MLSLMWVCIIAIAIVIVMLATAICRAAGREIDDHECGAIERAWRDGE